MPRNTDVFRVTFNGEGIVRSANITKDTRYGKNAPNHGMPHGHLPVVSYLAVPVKSQKGVVIGGLFFGHPEEDRFTEEHEHLVNAIASQAAIALDNAKLYEDLAAINSKKDEFIAYASHELKTPLTTISGYMQLASRKKELPPDVTEKVEKQVNRLNIIITDLLDLSRIQAGKLQLHFSKQSLRAVIQESVEAAGVTEHQVVLNLPKDDIEVTIDGQKIGQVIVNLVSNAAKYSAKGTNITIEAIRYGDEVRLSVKDEGIGISEDNLDKIFNQFYRIAKSSESTSGLGLGLFICREILDRHLGRIWVESKEEQGSTFFVLLPINRVTV